MRLTASSTWHPPPPTHLLRLSRPSRLLHPAHPSRWFCQTGLIPLQPMVQISFIRSRVAHPSNTPAHLISSTKHSISLISHNHPSRQLHLCCPKQTLIVSRPLRWASRVFPLSWSMNPSRSSQAVYVRERVRPSRVRIQVTKRRPTQTLVLNSTFWPA